MAFIWLRHNTREVTTFTNTNVNENFPQTINFNSLFLWRYNTYLEKCCPFSPSESDNCFVDRNNDKVSSWGNLLINESFSWGNVDARALIPCTCTLIGSCRVGLPDNVTCSGQNVVPGRFSSHFKAKCLLWRELFSVVPIIIILNVVFCLIIRL